MSILHARKLIITPAFSVSHYAGENFALMRVLLHWHELGHYAGENFAVLLQCHELGHYAGENFAVLLHCHELGHYMPVKTLLYYRTAMN